MSRVPMADGTHIVYSLLIVKTRTNRTDPRDDSAMLIIFIVVQITYFVVVYGPRDTCHFNDES